MPFACSICEEESLSICARCTKDTCANHLCERCHCCSDCCGCEVPLDDQEVMPETVHRVLHAEPVSTNSIPTAGPNPDPEPEPPHPPPDPDPFPGEAPGPEEPLTPME